MLTWYANGQGSVVIRFKIRDSSGTTNAGLTGLTSASSGLSISTIANNEATATTYTVAGSTIETITTLGTYAAPTSTKCRFKEVDATNMPGIYELHLADARFAVSNAKDLLVTVKGATNGDQVDFVIPLTKLNPHDTVRAGLTALPNAAADAAGGLPISDAGGLDLDGRLDAAVSSRMATYTQPSGFLAATFPTGTIANTTNITAGTISTVGTLTGHTPQTGDTYALANGVNGFVSIKADTAEILTDTGTTLPAQLTNMSGATFDTATDSLEALRNRGDAAWITATGFSTHNASDVWAVATRVLTAGTNIALAKGVGVTGFNDLDAAGVRSAVGLASANLDTQLTAIDDYLDTEVSAIKAKTDQMTFTTANRIDSQVYGMEANTVTASALASDAVTEMQSGLATAASIAALPTAAQNATAVLTTQLTEGYATDGAAPTATQALMLIQQSITDFSISGTSLTIKKLDGSTTAATLTLNDATSPTSVTRSG